MASDASQHQPQADPQPRPLTAAIAELSALARATRDRVWQRELLDLAAACSSYAKSPRPKDRERIAVKARTLSAAASQLGEDGVAAAAATVLTALTQPPAEVPVASPPPPETPGPPVARPAPSEPPSFDAQMDAAGGKSTEPLEVGAPRGHDPLVLIVDGDVESRRVLSTYFGSAGFRVAAFEDGGPALVKIREERPALVVADLLLPMVPGEVLILALRRSPTTATIPILVVTAEPWRLGPEHEVEGVLTKPVNVTVVVEAARRLLSATAGTDSLQASRA